MFLNQIIKLNKYLLVNLIILTCFFTFILISTINSKTISPSWFTDSYFPWKNDIDQTRLNTYGYKHGGHDQVMQFFFNRVDDSQTGFDENEYSIDWQMGLPKNTRVEFSNFTQKYIYNFLSKKEFANNNLKNIQIATNFSTFISFVICFLLVQIILNKIFEKNIENIFFSLILNPVFFLPSEEAWQMSITGIYLFILSFLILCEFQKKIGINKILQILILSFISGHFFINSMSFHYWLYPAIIGSFFSIFIFKKIGFNAFWLSIGFILAALVNASLIIETLNSLKISPSKLSINNVLSNIHQMEYAMLPLGYFIPDIILKEIYNYFNFDYWPVNSLINIDEGFWGFPLLILSIYGFIKTNDKTLKIGILLCILYWIGPLQFFLRVIVGGPFLSETSTGGRFGAIIYIILNMLSIYSYYLIKQSKFILPAFINKLNLSIIFFVLLQILYFNKQDSLWLFGFIYLLLVIIFQIGLIKKSIIFLLLSICILPFYNTFSKYGINSIYPNQTTNINNKTFNNNLFNKNSVGVIATSHTKKKYIKDPIHPNYLTLLNIRSLNGFVTPTNKYFLTLYNYQWMTNWPDLDLKKLNVSSIKDDEHKNFFDDIKNKIKRFLNKKKKIDPKNYELMLKGLHRHYTFPIPINKNHFSETTENFFDLVGVNYVFTDDKVDLNDKYQLLRNERNIKIWKRNKQTQYFRLLCKHEKNIYDISSIEKLLSNKFNFEKNVIIYENLNVKKCSKDSRLLKTKTDKNKNNFFIAELIEPGGILSTNFVWNKNLIAKDQNNHDLKTIICNVAFTCIVPNIKSSKIYLKYQKPSLFTIIKKKYFSKNLH
jgi:hypothetical protein